MQTSLHYSCVPISRVYVLLCLFIFNTTPIADIKTTKLVEPAFQERHANLQALWGKGKTEHQAVVRPKEARARQVSVLTQVVAVRLVESNQIQPVIALKSSN